jgi:hypothetical protein
MKAPVLIRFSFVGETWRKHAAERTRFVICEVAIAFLSVPPSVQAPLLC